MSKLSNEELLGKLHGWSMQARSLWTEKDEQAYQQIKKMIQKPRVTEEWYREKAHKLEKLIDHRFMTMLQIDEVIKILTIFIRSLVEEK